MSISSRIKSTLYNIPGWHTNRKIIVFESDDWGMIRMTSKKIYEDFLKMGYQVDQCGYNRNDSLESNEDMERLFEVLLSVKDKNDSPACITANNIVANPDFDKIEASNFQQYYYQPFNETLKEYPRHDQVVELYKKGIEKKIFIPQFHGREHVNINRWLKDLRLGKPEIRQAFARRMFTIHASGTSSARKEYLDAFGGADSNEIASYASILHDGIELFKNMWGFVPKSFIAPCYTWPPEMEAILKTYGIKYLQGSHVQRVAIADDSLKIKRVYHYLGQKNKSGQVYLVRNAFFEPSENKSIDWVNKCMSDIDLAFTLKKPAVISSHRVNYIGFINEQNREDNLKLLSKLLKLIRDKFPDAEFMTSDKLGDLISAKNNA